MNTIPMNFTGTTLTFVDMRDGEQYCIPTNHINFERIKLAIKRNKIKEAVEAVTVHETITNRTLGRLVVQGGQVFYDGVLLDTALTRIIVKFIRQNHAFEPLLHFLDKLMKNPSYRSREQLYGFIEKHLFAIAPDGDFVAYKRINSDFTDCYSGKIDNSVGAVVTMDRGRVNDNPDQTCSAGLHVCGREYLTSFGGAKLVMVYVNPEHVVSIPSDYNHAKMRVCQYTVMMEISEAKPDDELSVVIDLKNGKFHNVRDASGRFAKASDSVPTNSTRW